MQPNHFSKALILTLIIVFAFASFWELYWRHKGYGIAYNDDKYIWAAKRKQIYQPANRSTVFIGASRSKFDIDISTWEKLTGEKAVQLAFVGVTPRPILHNLADDENFRGKVVIGVTESVFFAIDSTLREAFAREALGYYYSETPAQMVSTQIGFLLESKLVFLEEGKFGLTELLRDIRLRGRKGTPNRPPLPREFYVSNYQRQTLMTPMFIANPQLQNKKKQAWTRGVLAAHISPIKGDTLQAYLQEIKNCIDKIRSRGGMVVFIRPPSDGIMLAKENTDYPRKDYWDQLIKFTETPGYYYSDYPSMANLKCVEESHLSPHNAVIYTEALINILKTQKGWTFPQSYSSNLKP